MANPRPRWWWWDPVCIALWVLLGTLLFSRDIEQVTLRTGVATLFVIAGVVVIYLA